MMMPTLALLLALVPGGSATPTALGSTSWLGVTLGEPQAQMFQTQGEAGYGIPAAGRGAISYTIDRGNGLLDVSFRDGYVQSIGLRKGVYSHVLPTVTDPSGIALGASRDDVIAKRGAGSEVKPAKGWPYLAYTDPDGTTWSYYLLDGVVRDIVVAAPDAALDALPAAAVPDPKGGRSYNDAILNGAAEEPSGAANEAAYVLNLRCSNGGALFREAQQSLANRDGRTYDILHLQCYQGDETRDLYFDITPFFGKS